MGLYIKPSQWGKEKGKIIEKEKKRKFWELGYGGVIITILFMKFEKH